MYGYGVIFIILFNMLLNFFFSYYLYEYVLHIENKMSKKHYKIKPSIIVTLKSFSEYHYCFEVLNNNKTQLFFIIEVSEE